MNDVTPDITTRGASYSAMTFSFLAGGIAGAAAALLLAPHSGKVTREIMGRKMGEAAGSARDLRDRAIRRGQELREEATTRVGDAASALAGKTSRTERGNGDVKDAAPSV